MSISCCDFRSKFAGGAHRLVSPHRSRGWDDEGVGAEDDRAFPKWLGISLPALHRLRWPFRVRRRSAVAAAAPGVVPTCSGALWPATCPPRRVPAAGALRPALSAPPPVRRARLPALGHLGSSAPAGLGARRPSGAAQRVALALLGVGPLACLR